MFTLLKKVMEFLAPRDEMQIPEKDLPKVEEIPKGASRRNMNHGLGSNYSSKDGSPDKDVKEEEEEEEEVHFEIEKFPKHLQMLHALLKVCLCDGYDP